MAPPHLAARPSAESPSASSSTAASLTDLQHLADQGHCIPPLAVPLVATVLTPGSGGGASPPNDSSSQNRTGSRTYQEAMLQQRQQDLYGGVSTSRDASSAGTAPNHASRPGAADDSDLMSMNELRVEMETLLSLRRRSMNQPLTVDPDLPPTSPPTSSPPTAHTPNMPTSPTPSFTIDASVSPANATPSQLQHQPGSHRPQLTLQLSPPVLEGPTGGPISPTAPSPAETGTLTRRRSTVAPKLPSEHPLPSPPPLPNRGFPSPFGGLAPPSANASGSEGSDSSSSSASAQAISPTSQTSYLDIPLASTSSSSSSELFWLPASLHPELAPQEFKAFIREQTTPEALARRSSVKSTTTGTGGARVGPAGGSRIGRRASLLRGEYKPRQDDGVGDSSEASRGGGVAPRSDSLQRTTSEGNRRGRRSVVNFEELTIKDLQRLEELAAKAEAEGTTAGEEEEGERLGRVLRRSLSLNPHRVAAAAAAAAAAEQADEASSGGPSRPLGSLVEERPDEMTDEEPLIVPPPGQILRRNARTRIRKDSADIGRAGGSRFGSGPTTRRQRTSTGGDSVGSGSVDLRASTSSSAYGGTVEDDNTSAGDHSVEDSVSYESHDDYVRGIRAPPPSAESDVVPGLNVPAPSPSASLDNQHIEFSMPSEHPTVMYEEPDSLVTPIQQPAPAAVVSPAPPVSSTIPDETPPALPQRPAAVSPASADYDWATHNLPTVTAAPPTQSPPSEPQYHVHPQHLSRQPFNDVPPPQAVPLPTYEREKPPSPSPSPPSSRSDSPKPSGKEKKSGWARLGLGRDDDKSKRKGRGKDDHSTTSSPDKGKESSGFLGGLFGRKNRDDHERPAPRAPSPPPEPKIPPPPPTASGVLLPNGQYANFYRLPIHVERAVYRLSHIKLANPRRPLYEQVLISNLMFWYLGLIQKPTTPPIPAAPPVPIPGMRAQQQQQQISNASSVSSNASGDSRSPAREPQKRTGLSKPGRGGRTAETPVRVVNYEVQNQQLAEEHRYQQQQRHLQQQQQQQEQQYAPLQTSNAPAAAPAKGFFAPPLSSTTAEPTARSPERASAPASMYPITRGRDPHETSDRASGWQMTAEQSSRESYPPNRPAAGSHEFARNDPESYDGPLTGLQSRRLSNGSQGDTPYLPSSGPASSATMRERRASAMSDKSFDASEIYDAYAPGSPLQGQGEGPEYPFAAVPNSGGAMLGAVAPRGSSLKALSGGGAPAVPVLGNMQERGAR